MTIGAVIPTRNNRPEFLSRCKEYMKRQTRKIDHLEVVDYPQVKFPIDLSDRYKSGLYALKDKCDVIFCIEDDDWYHPEYIDIMIALWEQDGKPEIYGIGETYFYHIGAKSYWHKTHPERACAYSTMIRSDAVDRINWDKMDKLLFDLWAWRQLSGKTTIIRKIIALGIKHGIGQCGAAGHNKWFYDKDKTAVKDPCSEWLRKTVGEEDAEWYIELAKTRKT